MLINTINNMEENQILKTVVDTLTGKKIHTLTVPVKWRPKLPWYKRLIGMRDKYTQDYQTFEIWPCVVNNQYRIAGNAAMLTDGLHQTHSDNIKFIIQNQPIVVYIVAAAIQNNHLEPEQGLIDFIGNNFDKDDLYTALRASFDNLGMEAFSNSIVLLKGTVKILMPEETSPKEGSELIASHTPKSEPYANTLDGHLM